MKKFYNHVLNNVPRDKYTLTADMWGSNGWEVAAVLDTGECYRVFLKRERQVSDEP